MDETPVVYTSLVFLIDTETWTPVEAAFYDGDELIRTMRYDTVRRVAGRSIPMRLVVTPADEPDERTVVLYEELQLDVPVDEALFTRRGLRRVARN